MLRGLKLTVLQDNSVKKGSGEKFNLEKYVGARFGEKLDIVKAT